MGTHVIVSQLTGDAAERSGLLEKGHDDMCPHEIPVGKDQSKNHYQKKSGFSIKIEAWAEIEPQGVYVIRRGVNFRS